MNNPLNASERILILAPTVNDGGLASIVLQEAGLQAESCRDVLDLCARLSNGAGVVIVSEEAMTLDSVRTLQSTLDRQEAWSDLPIIVLTGANALKAAELFSHSGNIALLERPFSRVTLVRSAEIALRARRKQYQVRDLLMALQASKEEAERATLAKTQFLANMSHEIRTPIGAIMGFIDIVKHTTDPAEDNFKYMGIIERNSHQLLRLIDDILDLSKVEVGKMTFEKLDFNLSEMLTDFVALMNYKATEKGILFNTLIDASVPSRITSDPLRLKQILSNVVGNAIKFTNTGSVELRVEFAEKKLRFTVTDTGVGLTEQQQGRLFQPFSQADSTTTRKFGGTGLGLILSRKLSESLGGSLKLIRSEINIGSTFQFEIEPNSAQTNSILSIQPLAAKAQADLVAKSIDSNGKSLKVLLVEDSIDNQVLLTTFLKKATMSVETVSDGSKGVEAAMAGSFDLVLMDIQMPNMDGHAATRMLRGLGYDKPIIALTAHAMNEEKARCLESGFTEYLTKPIGRDRLIETLSKYRH